MGQCLSVAPHCPKGATLTAIESELDTGDIVLLLDGSKSSKYLFKAGSAGGWARAATVGFLVREGPGVDGLALVHADENAGPGMARIVYASLAEEFECGQNRLAIIRRLRKRLTPQQVTLVREFVTLNAGKVIEEDPSPSSVLMASTAPATTTAFERLSCSDFVAMMLHLVGLVEPTNNPKEFVATHRKGRLAGPPCSVKLRHNSGNLTERLSPNSTDLNTPKSAAYSSRSSWSFQDNGPETPPKALEQQPNFAQAMAVAS